MTPQNSTTIGPVTAENVNLDTTKQDGPTTIEGVTTGANTNVPEVQPGEGASPAPAPQEGEAAGKEFSAEVIPASVEAEQNAAAEKLHQETGAPIVEVPVPRSPMKRLRCCELVIERILEKMGDSIHSPISKSDAEELREYLYNGNVDPEDEGDEE